MFIDKPSRNLINPDQCIYKKALELIPDGHANSCPHFNNIGHSLLICFLHLGNIEDIELLRKLSKQLVWIILVSLLRPISVIYNRGTSVFELDTPKSVDKHKYFRNLNDICFVCWENLDDVDQAVVADNNAATQKFDYLGGISHSYQNHFEH